MQTTTQYAVPLSVARKLYYEGGDQNALEAMRDNGDSGSECDCWRFIHESVIDEIMADELENDPELLGMFNADFLARVTGWPEALISAAQKGEQWDAIGEGVVDGGYVPALARAYAYADGYGHHFAHYDFETHELAGGWFAFQTN